jgi:site-specific recombinase
MFKLRNKQKKTNDIAAKKLGLLLPLNATHKGLDVIIELVKNIRPTKPNDFNQAETNFKAVLFQLQNDKAILFGVRKALLQIFIKTDINSVLTESGIHTGRGFIQELFSKLKQKILPPLQQENDFLYIIDRVFTKKRDFVWVQGIDPELWSSFFNIIGIQINVTDPRIDTALGNAMHVLATRLCTLSYDKEITSCLDNHEQQLYPFIEQARIANIWKEKGSKINDIERIGMAAALNEALHNCNQAVTLIRNQRRLNGTSLSQTFTLLKIQQHINRMFILLDVLDIDSKFNTSRFTTYFGLVVHNECTKDSIREFVSTNLGLLAYQIAEHKGRKGRLFITTTSKEFKHIVRSAMGGGFIISFIGVIKNLLNTLTIAPFTQGLLTSINYSLGFILIDQTKSTLATKQPAYTASALASSLDMEDLEAKPDFANVAVTMAKVSRSQIASFFGNLIIVFPLSFLIGWLTHIITGKYIIPVNKAMNVIQAQHPFQSASIIYAMFTGVFLFLSGIISGYVENNLFYGKVPERIINHPKLFRRWSTKRKQKIADFINRYAGAITGSIALGFFLGMSSVFSKIFGIPFDIRHITISAANVSLSTATMVIDSTISIPYLVTVCVGVLLIGFINFLTAFSLAFYVALKSRGIRLRSYPELFTILGKYFRKYPKDFILPPKGGREPEDLLKLI